MATTTTSEDDNNNDGGDCVDEERSCNSNSVVVDISAPTISSRRSIGVKRMNSTDELDRLAADNLSHCLFGITVLPDDSAHSNHENDNENDDNDDNDENDDEEDVASFGNGNKDGDDDVYDDEPEHKNNNSNEEAIISNNYCKKEGPDAALNIVISSSCISQEDNNNKEEEEEEEEQQQQQQHHKEDYFGNETTPNAIQQQQSSSDCPSSSIVNSDDGKSNTLNNTAQPTAAPATGSLLLSGGDHDDDADVSDDAVDDVQQPTPYNEVSSTIISQPAAAATRYKKNLEQNENKININSVGTTSSTADDVVIVVTEDCVVEEDSLLGNTPLSSSSRKVVMAASPVHDEAYYDEIARIGLKNDGTSNSDDNNNAIENNDSRDDAKNSTTQTTTTTTAAAAAATTAMKRTKPRKGRRTQQQPVGDGGGSGSGAGGGGGRGLGVLHENSCRAVEWYKRPGMWKERHHVVDVKRLRKIVTSGIVEEGSHRAVAWRVLFGYLPPDNALWDNTLLEKRKLYHDLVTNLFVDTSDAIDGTSIKGRRRRRSLFIQRQKSVDSLDSNNSNSASYDDQSNPNDPSNGMSMPMPKRQPIPPALIDYWKTTGKDLRSLERISHTINALRMDAFVGVLCTKNNESNNKNDDALILDNNISMGEKFRDFADSADLLDEIHRDVIRTHPEMSFFLEPASFLGKRRYAAIERILFVWSKHNKGVRYVQGMNEIVGILYFVLANDQNDEWAAGAEPDTYWLLHTILTEMQDVFVADLDNADTGIQGRIQAMHALLQRHDPEVAEHLHELGLEPSYYAVRWWTTLLSREFLLPDTIRLWDSMFASTHKDNFLRYVCATMIMMIRDDLLNGDFGTCLRTLQAYPSTHTDHLLEACRALWLYESQITVACHRGGISLHQALCTIQSPPALIMAFGLKNGKPPVSRTERAIEKAEQTVQKVTTSAQGMLGRAFGFYQRYNTNRSRSRSEDSGLDSTTSSSNNNNNNNKNTSSTTMAPDITEQPEKSSDDCIISDIDDNQETVETNNEEDEDIYLNAILNAKK